MRWRTANRRRRRVEMRAFNRKVERLLQQVVLDVLSEKMDAMIGKVVAAVVDHQRFATGGVLEPVRPYFVGEHCSGYPVPLRAAATAAKARPHETDRDQTSKVQTRGDQSANS